MTRLCLGRPEAGSAMSFLVRFERIVESLMSLVSIVDFAQYTLPSIHLPHHASNNDDYGNGCWGPRHLHLQDYEYRRSGGSFILGLYRPDLIVCRAHVQVLPSISSPTLRAIPPTAIADPNQT